MSEKVASSETPYSKKLSRLGGTGGGANFFQKRAAYKMEAETLRSGYFKNTEREPWLFIAAFCAQYAFVEKFRVGPADRVGAVFGDVF